MSIFENIRKDPRRIRQPVFVAVDLDLQHEDVQLLLGSLPAGQFVNWLLEIRDRIGGGIGVQLFDRVVVINCDLKVEVVVLAAFVDIIEQLLLLEGQLHDLLVDLFWSEESEGNVIQ